jgi:hypothetical protein
VFVLLAGIPAMDPVEDMKIKHEDLQKTVERIAILEARVANHTIAQDPQLESLFALCNKKFDVSVSVD